MGIKWIRIAVIYLLIGVLFGLFMHATIQLQWKGTHAHINLVGWLTTAAFGIIYSLYPKMGSSKLGVTHFWIHTISVPLLIIGIFLIFVKPLRFMMEPFVWIGGLGFLVSIILMIYMVFTQTKLDQPNKVKGG